MRDTAVEGRLAAWAMFSLDGKTALVLGAAVAFLASDAARYVTGTGLLVDGGWSAIDGPPTGLTSTHRPG